MGAADGRDSGRYRSGPRHLAAGDARRPGDRVSPAGARSTSWWSPTDAPVATAPSDDGDGDGDGGAGGPGPGAAQHRARRSVRRTVLEWVAVIGGGIAIALVVEAFLVQAFWIPSPSMVPTLQVGDRVLVNKLSYKLHDVHRGDVIVFRRPEEAVQPGGDDIKDLIKRVVAVGGDTVEARDGQLYVNDELIDEPYLPAGTQTIELPRTEVPEGKVFVLGDNRGDSQDSRVFGPIDEDTIVGRAFVKVLPLTDLGWL
jgi:signal peptidase I